MRRTLALMLTDREGAAILAKHIIPFAERRFSSDRKQQTQHAALMGDLERVVGASALGPHSSGMYLQALASMGYRHEVWGAFSDLADHGITPGPLMYEACLSAAKHVGQLKTVDHKMKAAGIRPTKATFATILWTVQRLYKGKVYDMPQGDVRYLEGLSETVVAVLVASPEALTEDDYNTLCACAITEKAFVGVNRAMRVRGVRMDNRLRLSIMKGCVHRGDVGLARRTRAALMADPATTQGEVKTADARLAGLAMRRGDLRAFLSLEAEFRQPRGEKNRRTPPPSPRDKKDDWRYGLMFVACCHIALTRARERSQTKTHAGGVTRDRRADGAKRRKTVAVRYVDGPHEMAEADIIAAGLERAAWLRRTYPAEWRSALVLPRMRAFYALAGATELEREVHAVIESMADAKAAALGAPVAGGGGARVDTPPHPEGPPAAAEAQALGAAFRDLFTMCARARQQDDPPPRPGGPA